MNKKERMMQDIVRHGNDLLAIFPSAKIDSAIALCKALRRFELKAERITTALCNGVDPVIQEKFEKELERIEAGVLKLLGLELCFLPFFINRDPRGYALKLSDTYVADKQIHKDWGGYGIIAPDFTPNK